MGFVIRAGRKITRFTPVSTAPRDVSVIARHAIGWSGPRFGDVFGTDTTPGGSPSRGARTNTARRARGTTDNFGRPVVWWEDFAVTGDSLQAGLNRTATAYPSSSHPNGVHVSLPNGVFTWSGFSIGNKIGLQIGGGYGGTCRGFSGSGPGTHLRQTPHTTSGASIALVPQQATGSTNPLFQIMFTGVTNPNVENLSLDYTDQPVNSASSTSPTRPVLWNGLKFESCTLTSGLVPVTDVFFNAFGNGDNTANPGETFQFDVNHTDNIWIDHCTVDGAISSAVAAISGNTTAAGTKVASTGVGYNNLNNVTESNSIFKNSGYGHGTSCYQIGGAILHQNVEASGNSRAPWNHERSYAGATITFQGPIQYGNGQEQINIVGDHANVPVAIHDPVYGSATASPGTGGPMDLYVPQYYYFPIVAGTTHGPPNLQLCSSIHCYIGGTLDDHFLFNTGTDGAGKHGYLA